MSFNMKEALEKRARAIQQSRDLLNKADTEKRGLTAEERSQYDAWDKEVDELTSRIDIEEKQSSRESLLNKASAQRGLQQVASGEPAQKDTEARAAFQAFIRRGERGMTADERRALQQSSNSEGGYLVPTEQMINTLIRGVNNRVFIRELATKYQVPSAMSLGVPTVESSLADAEWTTELATGSEDTGITFGKRQLKPNPIAKRVKISRMLIQNAIIPVDTFVLNEMARVFGETMEKGYITGDGNEKPLGLFTASDDGIPTGRDVATDNTAAGVTFNGLIEAKYALREEYWNSAQWLFHQDTLKLIRKIKNAVDGNYVWEPSVRAGEPDTILNRPVRMSRFVPNTITANAYVGMFADFSYYWIADALDMAVQRLDELYAEQNKTGFIGRMSSDGMPVLAEAFVRIKLGAS